MNEEKMSIPPCSDLQILDIYPLNHWKKYIVLDRYFVLVCNFIVVWTKLPKKKKDIKSPRKHVTENYVK